VKSRSYEAPDHPVSPISSYFLSFSYVHTLFSALKHPQFVLLP